MVISFSDSRTKFYVADITTGSCKKRLTFLKCILSDTTSDQKWAAEFGEDTEGHQFSLDYLLDTFIVLYDECSNSSLRRRRASLISSNYVTMLSTNQMCYRVLKT